MLGLYPDIALPYLNAVLLLITIGDQPRHMWNRDVKRRLTFFSKNVDKHDYSVASLNYVRS